MLTSSKLPCRAWRVLLAVAVVQAGVCWRAAADEQRAGWLNVQDCGASGSSFETTASTTVGSNQIAVKDVGDFKVGQEVMVSKCNIQYKNATLRASKFPSFVATPLGDAMEVRGYDGSAGSWLVYVIDMDGASPLTFRWSDDLVHEYKWKGTKVPVTWDWQKLSNGIEVKFNKRDLQPGHLVTFAARDQLVTAITGIEGRTLTLRDPANRTVQDAVVRHCDTAALQAALDRGVKEKKNVFFPSGRYRLTASLRVREPKGTVIEGESGVNTILDISEGQGTCFSLYRGTDATIRNFCMVGHTGQAEQPGYLRTAAGVEFWACCLKGCNAVGIGGTDRVLVENVHASRMASECFISGGESRNNRGEPRDYTRSVTYLRCSVTDCAANAFNTGDLAEDANVLYCRVDGTGRGWHMFEGSGHSLRVIGCYVRNAGPVTVGDIVHVLPRLDYLNELGIGRAVVADNVFEGIGLCGGIRVNSGTAQVAIANNLFINYNGTAIGVSNATVHNSFPSQNIAITGNIIDMTCSGEQPAVRAAIYVSTNDTIVSDNQIYVRGACDPKVSGIRVREGAVNVNVHDNLVRNCAQGFCTERMWGKIDEVLDPKSFLQTGIPLQWRYSDLYRGWSLVWLKGGKPAALSVIDAYDPDTLRIRLKDPHEMKAGDTFEVYPPSANWHIHDNTISDCLRPVALNSYGSETSLFKDNVITRGGVAGVKAAVEVRGRFRLIGNHISGFDEKDSCGLALFPDALGRVPQNGYYGNIFEQCANGIAESQKGLWEASRAEGNLFTDCGTTPRIAK